MKKYAKIAALLMAFVLVIAGTVGVTMALLTDKTDPLQNTFTVGKVDIELSNYTTQNYKLIPGNDITEATTVIVNKGSEACYLFVKLDGLAAIKSASTDKITYNLDGWTPLAGQTDVYYREVGAVAADAADNASYAIFAGSKITIPTTLTSDELTAIGNIGKITITAYACQKENVADAATAWAQF